MIQFANVSAEDLRARNIPEAMIQQIEANRPNLQRLMAMRQAAAANGGQPGNVAPGVPVPAQQPPQQQQIFSQVPQHTNAIVPPHVEPVGPAQPGLSSVGPVPGVQNVSRPGPMVNGAHPISQLRPMTIKPTPEQVNFNQQVIRRIKEDFVQNRSMSYLDLILCAMLIQLFCLDTLFVAQIGRAHV